MRREDCSDEDVGFILSEIIIIIEYCYMGVDYSYEDRCSIPVNQELQSLIEKYVKKNCASYGGMEREGKRKKREEGKKWCSLRNAFVVNGTCKEVISEMVERIKEFEEERGKESDDDEEEEEEKDVNKEERKKRLFGIDEWKGDEMKKGEEECKGKSCVNYKCNYNWGCSYKEGNEGNYGRSVYKGNNANKSCQILTYFPFDII